MDTMQALRYLREQHQQIASAYVRGQQAIRQRENVTARECLAIEIREASLRGDDAALVQLAEQWKRG